MNIFQDDPCKINCVDYPCINKQNVELDDPINWNDICNSKRIIDFKEISKKIPHPYRITEHGIEIQKQLENKTTNPPTKFNKWFVMCNTPMWIKNKYVNPDNNTVFVELEFKDVYNKLNSIRVNQKEILNKQGLINLTQYGINFIEKEITAIEEYFSACLSEITYEIHPIFTKCGWHHTANGFVLGNKLIRANSDIDIYYTEDIPTDKIDALKQNGTIKEWIKLISPFLKYDNVRFLCYNACTAPLLQILNCASYVEEQTAKTSTGKTTAAKIAMSIWGNPDRLKLSTDATAYYVEQLCSVYCDLPILLDDTTLMDKKVLQKITYMVANEVGKGRGKKEGGMRKEHRWKSVCLTTSENSLLNTRVQGGAEVRTVQISGGIGDDIPDIITKYERNSTCAYGHIGHAFIKKIFEHQDILKLTYEKYIKALSNRINSKNESSTSIINRLVNTYAAIALAGKLFEEIMSENEINTQNQLSIVYKMLDQRIDNKVGRTSDVAYEYLHEWISKRYMSFHHDGTPIGSSTVFELLGNIHEVDINSDMIKCVDILPHILENVIDDYYENKGILKVIISDWITDGRLIQYETKDRGIIKKRIKTPAIITHGEPVTSTYRIIIDTKMVDVAADDEYV